MSRTIAFVMDPLSKIQPSVDTTFAFMLAAQNRDHQVVYVPPANIDLRGSEVTLRGHVVEVSDTEGAHFRLKDNVALPGTSCDAIFIRTDPPFDEAYLTATWLLDFAIRQGIRVINHPNGLQRANEHLFALEFPQLCPKTIVSASREVLFQFVKSVGGQAIAKPIDGHGGFGVVKLRVDDTNIYALIDMLTQEGQQPTMAQAFLPQVSEGDKRLIVIDGQLRGCVRRVPQKGDHRGNVHVGGAIVADTPNEVDARIVQTLAPRLRELGLFFVGLDVIGDRLIEINTTSPTLIREIHNLGGPDLATEVIEAIESPF